MYQINLRAQASKLVAMTTRWPLARVQQPASESRRHTSHLRAALAELANLVILCRMPGSPFDTTERQDPRAPGNW